MIDHPADRAQRGADGDAVADRVVVAFDGRLRIGRLRGGGRGREATSARLSAAPEAAEKEREDRQRSIGHLCLPMRAPPGDGLTKTKRPGTQCVSRPRSSPSDRGAYRRRVAAPSAPAVRVRAGRRARRWRDRRPGSPTGRRLRRAPRSAGRPPTGRPRPSARRSRAPAATGNVAVGFRAVLEQQRDRHVRGRALVEDRDVGRRLTRAAQLALGEQPARRRPRSCRLPLTASSSVPLVPHHLVRSTTIGALASTVMPSVVFASDGCTDATSTVWRLLGASV